MDRLNQRISCFLVSNLDGNPKAIENTPVKKADDCETDDETLVIIAVKNDAGIREKLEKMGVNHIIHLNELKLWFL